MSAATPTAIPAAPKSGAPSDMAVEVIGVTKRFKNLTAVDNLSVSIPRGQFTALLGPNGAGKTTLVEMIEGIQAPTSGTIRLFGLGWAGNQRELYGSIGVALQETSFMEKVTVLETLNLFGSFYGQATSRSLEILDLIGLGEKKDTYVLHLSGGQKQRLVLGVALINRPRILLLDEPTTGLDPQARRSVWQIVQGLRQDGTTLLLTTHYMEEAEQLCEQILIMDQGRILAGGTMAELSALHGGGEIVEFSCEPRALEAFATLPGVRAVETNSTQTGGTEFRLVVDSGTTFLPLLLAALDRAGLRLDNLGARRRTLDDLFALLTGRHLSDASAAKST